MEACDQRAKFIAEHEGNLWVQSQGRLNQYWTVRAEDVIAVEIGNLKFTTGVILAKA